MKTKLTQALIEAITKKLKVGAYVKYVALSENISERVYYKWIARGLKSEKLAELGKKIPETEKIYVQFVQSVRQADAEAQVVMTTMVFAQGRNDWRAALELMARKWPEQWARKEYMDFKGTIDSGPNKGEEALNEFENMYKDVPRGALSDIIAETTRKLRDAKNGQNGKNQKVKTRK